MKTKCFGTYQKQLPFDAQPSARYLFVCWRFLDSPTPQCHTTDVSVGVGGSGSLILTYTVQPPDLQPPLLYRWRSFFWWNWWFSVPLRSKVLRWVPSNDLVLTVVIDRRRFWVVTEETGTLVGCFVGKCPSCNSWLQVSGTYDPKVQNINESIILRPSLSRVFLS